MYRNILVPLDGSELAETVLTHVEELAKAGGGPSGVQVTLLQVCEPIQGRITGMDFEGVYVMPNLVERAEETCRKAAEDYLVRTAERLREKGLNVRTAVAVGRAGGEILDYAGSHPVDLIAIASHGRSGISRWAYGSVASQVLRGIGTPILVVTPPREG